MPIKAPKRLYKRRRRAPGSPALLKKKLDAVFSKYVRHIHPAKCYTCGKVKQRKNLQCGHFISRVYLATRWEPDNCRPQCAGCNIFGNGMFLEFEERLTQELGAERVSELKRIRHNVFKPTKEWYLLEILRYQQLLGEK